MVGFLKIMDSMMIPEVEDMILMRSAPVGPMTSSVLGDMSSMGHFWEFFELRFCFWTMDVSAFGRSHFKRFPSSSPSIFSMATSIIINIPIDDAPISM